MQSVFALASAVTLAWGAAAGHAPHWGYDGPDGPGHWGAISPDFATCGTGKAQSPIDIGAFDAHGATTISTDYHAGPLTLLNNGHTVQANFAPGSKLTSGGHDFTLIQVHFHTPSEHIVSGKHYPLVAHFVHADSHGALAVLGVFFEEGAANPELAKLVAAAPAHPETAHAVDGATLDPNGLVPTSHSVYRYSGSLTTPPCTEGVNWHVAMEHMTASGEQIAALHAIMGNNARPVQALNDRHLVSN